MSFRSSSRIVLTVVWTKAHCADHEGTRDPAHGFLHPVAVGDAHGDHVPGEGVVELGVGGAGKPPGEALAPVLDALFVNGAIGFAKEVVGAGLLEEVVVDDLGDLVGAGDDGWAGGSDELGVLIGEADKLGHLEEMDGPSCVRIFG